MYIKIISEIIPKTIQMHIPICRSRVAVAVALRLLANIWPPFTHSHARSAPNGWINLPSTLRALACNSLASLAGRNACARIRVGTKTRRLRLNDLLQSLRVPASANGRRAFVAVELCGRFIMRRLVKHSGARTLSAQKCSTNTSHTHIHPQFHVYPLISTQRVAAHQRAPAMRTQTDHSRATKYESRATMATTEYKSQYLRLRGVGHEKSQSGKLALHSNETMNPL